ncbi:MAG: cytochrome c3 family protein [Oryzomonas sp.]|uniref:cytochrome c3 family protein n=1 Tax=Oryzomonas sp. TaxID=2855186 RepID=UPI00283FC81B|nr:cytochrome c3 family protein [Oryzomonas sp.]MDR3581628.1 cytochrome c3 family protein [Oryzomonas sp.]
MKQTAVALLSLLAISGSAFAAPEVIELKNKVSFPHKEHMAITGTCSKCHIEGVGKIKGFGKDWAHKNCKGCHAEMQKGPLKCSGCHKWKD